MLTIRRKPTMRLNHLQTLGSASFGLAAASICALAPSPVQAAGLVGAFARDKWTLNRYTAEFDIVQNKFVYTLVDSLPGNAAGVPALDFPYSYSCGSDGNPPGPAGLLGSSACVAISDAGSQVDPASFQVFGTSTNEVPGTSGDSLALNAPDTRTLVEWSLAYSGPDVRASFDFLFQSNDGPNAIQGYLNIGDTPFEFNPITPNATFTASSNMPSIFPESFIISNGDVLRYGVYTDATSGTIGNVSITAFDVEPVPAPLPLLGAGAAFGWSRRLRSRLRRPAAGGVTGD